MTRIPSVSDLSDVCTVFERNVTDGIQIQFLGANPDHKQRGEAQKALQQMQARLRRSIYFLKQRHNSCSPLGRLTDELISRILQYCFWGDNQFLEPSDRFTIPSAFSLCARWRNIAISSPSLWSTIYLPCSPTFFKLLRDRNGSSPLSVFISNEMFGTNKLAVSRIGSRVTEPLNEIAPRICDLTVQWDEWSYETQSFNSLMRQHIGLKEFSALQFFDLSGTDRHCPDNAPCTLNTPVLRTLKLYVDISNIPQLSLQHLVSLEYECWFMTPPQILDVLTLFPALERCSMIDDDPEGEEEEDNVDRPVVVMNRMQFLSIKFRFVKDVDYLLDHIETPATATKVMNLWGPSGEEDGPTLESLIGSRMSSYDELRIVQTPRLLEATLTSKSGGSLQFPHGPRDSDRPLETISFSALASYPSSLSRIELVIPALPSTTRLIAFLRPSPLVHIRIHTHESSLGRLLTALEYTPDVVCPHLESIDCTGTPFSAARMRNFLNFRETKGVALRELKITKGLCDPDASSLVSIIESLVEVDEES